MSLFAQYDVARPRTDGVGPLLDWDDQGHPAAASAGAGGVAQLFGADRILSDVDSAARAAYKERVRHR
jgi:hypothetical protein